MTNEEIIALLTKAGITTDNTGGLLNTEQADRFIQTTVDQSDFLKSIRIEKNIGTSRDLDSIGVGTRLIHKPVEDTPPADDKLKGITTGKRTLTPVEVMLPYNISLRWLEENISRMNAEEQINQEFGKQFANDLVDLSINGNTSVLVSNPDYNFLSILDGYFKKLEADPNKQFYNRAGSTDWRGVVFNNLLKLLPDKYKIDPAKLVFLVSFDAEEEYRAQLTERVTALGDAYLTENRRAMYKGIVVEPVPTFSYGQTLLTAKSNLTVGFGRDISVYKQFIPRARRVEYTISAKVDANYVLSDLNVYTV